MPRYSAGANRAGVNAANTVLMELRCASNARAFLRELGVTFRALSSAAPALVLARATNTPAGGTNSTPIPSDAADGAALTSCVFSGQTTAPTFTTGGPFPQIAGIPLTIGAGFIWTFGPADMIIPLSGSLLLANLNASGTTLGSFDIYAKWDE